MWKYATRPELLSEFVRGVGVVLGASEAGKRVAEPETNQGLGQRLAAQLPHQVSHVVLLGQDRPQEQVVVREAAVVVEVVSFRFPLGTK